MSAPLTALALTNHLKKIAKAPPAKARRITDEKGLHLLVKAGQTTGSWVLRYSLHGKRRDLGLGSYPEVSLAEAREEAAKARALVRQGVDPKAARKETKAEQARAAADAKAKSVTFLAAMEATLASQKAIWSNPKHAKQWRASLELHVLPTLGGKPVGAITVQDVRAVLEPIWTSNPETASRIRQRLKLILDRAKAEGWRDGDNPALWSGQLKGLLPDVRAIKKVQHHPALPHAQMPAFMAALSKVEGMGARALEFAILTAARTGEVRGARWGEFDLKEGIWTVPAERMKARRAHRVPLSAGVMRLLCALRPAKVEAGGLVFPGAGGAMLSDMTISSVIRRMNEAAGDGAAWRDAYGAPVVPHGFRSSFRDWAGETRAEAREVVERALAHTIRNGTEAAYARSDLLEKRRPLMDAWAAHCLGEATNPAS